MAFKLGRKKSITDLEEEREHLVVEEEVVTKRAEIEERKAVISELKKKYGSGWAKTLGISKLTDLTSLRSFLVSAKRGLDKQAGPSPFGARRNIGGSDSLRRVVGVTGSSSPSKVMGSKELPRA